LSRRRRRGLIVAIEGVDAVGKRTQSVLLQAWLKRRRLKAASLSFPDYETPIGGEIRAFLSGERDFQAEVRHMLFAANRWEKVPIISRSRTENDVVIVNRYTESNLVYGAANGLRLEWLAALEDGVPRSDLVLVLDAPPKGLVSRRPGPKDSYERDHDMQVRVGELYRELAPRFGWTVIDGSGSIQSVHRSVAEAVRRSLEGAGRTATGP